MSEQQTTSPDPTASALTLTFEAWAELSARLLNLDKEARLDVLFEREVDPAAFARCDAHYVLELGRDMAQGRNDRVDSYAQKCVAEMERRKAAPPEPVAEAETSRTGDEEALAAPPQADATGVPSFLQEQPVPPPPALDVAAPKPAVPLSPKDLASTSAVFAMPSALRAGALPFSSTAAPSITAKPAEPNAPRPPQTGVDPVLQGATMPLGNNLSAIVKAVLPFAGSPGPKPPSSAGPTPPTFPRLPLQTYASLCAELAVFPAKSAEILKRYNIADDAARAAVDKDWQTRLDAHPATKAEWQQLFTAYRDWLSQQQKR